MYISKYENGTAGDVDPGIEELSTRGAPTWRDRRDQRRETRRANREVNKIRNNYERTDAAAYNRWKQDPSNASAADTREAQRHSDAFAAMSRITHNAPDTSHDPFKRISQRAEAAPNYERRSPLLDADTSNPNVPTQRRDVEAENQGSLNTSSSENLETVDIPTTPLYTGRSGNYTIRGGDTLGAVARKHGVSVSELMRSNGIQDANKIAAGAKLNIPGLNTNTGTPPVPPTQSETPAVQDYDDYDTSYESDAPLTHVSKLHYFNNGLSDRLLDEDRSNDSPLSLASSSMSLKYDKSRRGIEDKLAGVQRVLDQTQQALEVSPDNYELKRKLADTQAKQKYWNNQNQLLDSKYKQWKSQTPRKLFN